MTKQNTFKKINVPRLLGITSLGVCLAGGVVFSEYADVPFISRYKMGRTKNAVATVVSGIVAEKMSPDAKIRINVRKTLYPDGKVNGGISSGKIKTSYGKWSGLGSTRFEAERKQDSLTGKVYKSEFDWKINETKKDEYEIKRMCLKLNYTLNLKVNNGKVEGRLIRPLAFDWNISGTYNDASGEVDIYIKAPLTLDLSLEGKIIKSGI